MHEKLMFDAVKAVDTSLQNEVDQLNPPEARYWAAEKKSKAENDSDDDIFAVDDDFDQQRNRTAGITECEVRTIVVGAVGELEQRQDLKIAESEARVGKRLEEQLQPLKQDVEVMKQTATETSLGVKALLQRQPAALPVAPAAPAWPAQSYPQAPAWAGKGSSGNGKGGGAKGKGWSGKGGWKRACWRCGSQEHLMGSCPIALAEKAALVNSVAESLGSFDQGGTEVFAAWKVVNQFSAW